ISFMLVISLALLAAFIALERRRSHTNRSVLVELSLFRIPTFRLGAFTAFLVSLGEFGLIFVLPLLLQGALGYSALATGWLMMALALGTFAASALVPHLVRAWGKVAVVRVGLASEAGALILLAALVTSPTWALSLILFIYGAGLGLASAQLTDTTMADVPVEYSGVASGLQTTIRQLGSAMGIAVLGGLMIARLTTLTETAFAHASTANARELAQLVHDSVGAAIPTIGEHYPQAAKLASQALIHAAQLTISVAAAILILSVVAAFFLPDNRTRERN
ncbi:MAG: MFS transporter, partial [Bowdeniella nasicola]|nr:MFS transporter [Bowdeniella nasicola]